MIVGNKFNDTFLSDEKKQWDEHASKYDLHRHNNPVYMSCITTAVNNLSLNDKDIVLDACVGTGLSIKKYPIRPARTIAFDLSFESLRILQKGSVEIDFVQGDMAKLPFADSIFDKVLFANALQHLPKESLRRTSINQISRVLRQNSLIVISTHNFSVTKKNRGWSKSGTAGSTSGQVQYIYSYELDEFRSLLQSYLIVDRIIGAGFPLPYKYKLSPLSRIIEKFLRRIQKFAFYGHMLIGVCQKPH